MGLWVIIFPPQFFFNLILNVFNVKTLFRGHLIVPKERQLDNPKLLFYIYTDIVTFHSA